MNKIFSSLRLSSAARAIARCALCTGSNVPPRIPAFWVNNPPSGADLSVPQNHEFLRGQAFEPHRPARVQLVGGNADLGAQAVLVAVGEARRGVPYDGARIDLAQEALGAAAVLRDDRVGVLRAVLGDVRDR